MANGPGTGFAGQGGGLSNSTFSDAGAAVSDIFAGFGDQSKAQGDYAERDNYNLASQYASNESTYTQWSTNIKQAQETRDITKSLGQTTADVAGAGFASSGSALDLLRDSASQGALAKATLGQQGLITEAGYQEQATSYANMANAAQMAGDAEKTAATGAFVAGGIQAVASVATLA